MVFPLSVSTLCVYRMFPLCVSTLCFLPVDFPNVSNLCFNLAFPPYVSTFFFIPLSASFLCLYFLFYILLPTRISSVKHHSSWKLRCQQDQSVLYGCFLICLTHQSEAEPLPVFCQQFQQFRQDYINQREIPFKRQAFLKK